MAKLLSLFNYEKSQEVFLPYLIFSSSQKKNLDFLSPSLMRLSDDLFVIDLQITQSYWEKRAKKEAKAPQELIEEVFQSYLPESPIQLFCEHPFQGLVFFLYLKEQNSKGFFSTHSLFARKIYDNMGWQSWIWAARLINDCFENNKVLVKERKNFSSQLRRFLSFIERTDLTEFSDLKQAHFHEIQRRFQGFLGKLWQWSFPQAEDNEDLSLFFHYEKLKGFAWIPYEKSPKPQIKTWLEYPLSYWEEIKPLLICDFEKLSQKKELQSPYKLLNIEWNFTLYDLSHLKQSIPFKHPLCLSIERKKEFSTLIGQFSFAFEQFKETLKEKNQDLDVINTPLILGWTLKVSQRVQIREKNQNFIFENKSENQSAEELKELNNKLQKPLESYVALEHFIPGLDFISQDLQHNDNPLFTQKLLMPKPFYLFPKERKLQACEIVSSQFLDRSSQDWWNREESLDSVRDCFICQLKNKELVFAFRNFQGEWFQYGY